MELKSLKDFISIIAINSSNCTFMELKFEKTRAAIRQSGVLIVPLWN